MNNINNLNDAIQASQGNQTRQSQQQLSTEYNVGQDMSITVQLDQESVNILKNASKIYDNAIVNAGIKLFSKTAFYKNMMQIEKPDSVTTTNQEEDLNNITDINNLNTDSMNSINSSNSGNQTNNTYNQNAKINASTSSPKILGSSFDSW